ncbi:uroporphyrinogen decarboxylase family protein [Clostridium thailandense]|uniref:uroporphyrinogen decarboxylase family protein n=1 Tax=Clostridium thailandense TaxID=2794346 RepID=UPI00398940F9
MKTKQELYNERLGRLNKTLALEKTDRPPVILQMDGFCATHMGYTLAELCKGVKESNKIMLESLKALGDVDGSEASFSGGPIFPLTFLARVKLPGRELPENMMWQLDEAEMMLPGDYDTIINKGWSNFAPGYLRDRLKIDVDKLMEDLTYGPQATKNITDEGYLVYKQSTALTVNEYLGGGRSMVKFMRDLFKIPDKVEATLEVMQKEIVEGMRKQIRDSKASVVFLSPARGASEFFSPKLWERFVWKYIKETADAVIEEGAVCNIHMDGDWERDLNYFKDFPKGKIVLETDGATDIYKVKEILGSNACIKGDVPAAKLCLATPEEVYNYSTKLIKDMGEGFILSSGCSVPSNAKVENVKAMISAAIGK